MESTPAHTIKYVASRTGLTPHVIRAWERRYKALSPQRTASNRRLYTEADIERLQLLHNGVAAGHSIRQLAQLTDQQLRELGRQEVSRWTQPVPTEGIESNESSPLSYVEASLSAVLNLDMSALDSALNQAAINLSPALLIEQVVAPLVQKLGDLWSSGSVKIVHEHMASSAIRSFLGDLLRMADTDQGAPTVIFTTPVGQLHELGALMAAVVAAVVGWRAVYLGPNMPAEEIAHAAEQMQARVVALSIVYPSDDPRVVWELKKLRSFCAEGVELIVGGRGAEAYAQALDETGVIRYNDISSFRSKLHALRSEEPN